MQTPSIGRARPSEPARRRTTSGASAGTADFAQHVGLLWRSTIEKGAGSRECRIADCHSRRAGGRHRRGAPREAAGRYGIDLLDRLTALRMEVLEGRVSASRLTALAHAIRKDRAPCGDLRVDEILDAIELRVEVELAKLDEVASAGHQGSAAKPNS